MGRPERPLPDDGGPVAAFAAGLRALRLKAGTPTYREMSRRAHCSHGALARAASGLALPSLTVTLAFVRACGGDTTEWAGRWRAEAGSPPVTARTPLPSQPVADGSDPKRAGVDGDVVTLDAVEVIFPDTVIAGWVELRYSPSHAVAWSRFDPLPALDHMAGVEVTVGVWRPADGRELWWTMAYPYGTVWSDILRTSPGGVVARARVVTPTGDTGMVGTRCLPEG